MAIFAETVGDKTLFAAFSFLRVKNANFAKNLRQESAKTAETVVIFFAIWYNIRVWVREARKSSFALSRSFKRRGRFILETYAFISDLDEFFCKEYADYDKLCVLPGYVMPKMQTTERRSDGTDYSYTLPAKTMSLSNQQNAPLLLAELKSRLVDKTLSFSFVPLGFFTRCFSRFSKKSFLKQFTAVCARYAIGVNDALAKTSVGEKVRKRIAKGTYIPSKNLLFTIALRCGFSVQDTEQLLSATGEKFDFTLVKDVVVCYLLVHKVHASGMIDVALAEYKIDGLFF